MREVYGGGAAGASPTQTVKGETSYTGKHVFIY